MPVRQLGMGDYLDLGAGYGLEVLYPPKQTDLSAGLWALPEYSRNNSSLVLRLIKDGHGIALFAVTVRKRLLPVLWLCRKMALMICRQRF